MCRSHTPVCCNTTKAKYFLIHGIFKRKSALMLFDIHPEFKQKGKDRHFWARGYYCETVGNVNEETIKNYIKEQEESDKISEE